MIPADRLSTRLTDGESTPLGVLSVHLDGQPCRVGCPFCYLTARNEPRHAPDVALLVSLVSPEFATRLIDDGLLGALVDLPAVDRVALNGLKPPPRWCRRSFWMAAASRLRPLLARALDHKLFLDCYVAARIFGL